MYDMSIVNIW